jgi:antitoxin component YwqK of YwqJK toxin-antitoxin module
MNNLNTIQDHIFQIIKSKYPDAIAKKINKDIALEILIPSINENVGYYFVCNTKVEGKLFFYFICRDKELIDLLLRVNSEFTPYFTSGVKPPTQNYSSADSCGNELILFCEKIKSSIKNNPETTDEFAQDVITNKVANEKKLKRDKDNFVPHTQHEDGKYDGEKLKGQKNGTGRFTDDEGNNFEGRWAGDEFVKGKITYHDGSIEEGDFVNGELHGQGKTYVDGQIFQEGDFKKGVLNGKGKSYHENGAVAEDGEFVDDELNGQGKKYYENGQLWREGEFRGGQLNGKGKEYNKNGGIEYEGEFREDKLHGLGKWYLFVKGHFEDCILSFEGNFVEGEIFGYGKSYDLFSGQLTCEGEFKGAALNGKGKMYDDNGTITEEGVYVDGKLNGTGKCFRDDGSLQKVGVFKDGKLHGKGKTYYEDGKISREGNFFDDELNGQGKKYYGDGSVYDGLWDNGKRSGLGKMYYADGDIYQGLWKEDKKVGVTKKEEQTKKEQEKGNAEREKEKLRKQKEEEKIRADREKTKLRRYEIWYYIKFTKEKTVSDGWFIFSQNKKVAGRGDTKKKTILMEFNGIPKESDAIKHIKLMDDDIRKGLAGASTILIESIKER